MLSTNFKRNIKQQMLNIKAKYVKKKNIHFFIKNNSHGMETRRSLRCVIFDVYMYCFSILLSIL